MPDWQTMTARLESAKRRLSEEVPGYPWAPQAPRPGCDESGLTAIAELLGSPLDRQHREFLAHCDGWPEFFLGTVLFGSAEFLGSEFPAARELLQYAELGEHDPNRLCPIAASAENINIFVLEKGDGPDPARVIWFAGYEVEAYQDFEAFFTMVTTSFEEELARPAQDRPY